MVGEVVAGEGIHPVAVAGEVGGGDRDQLPVAGACPPSGRSRRGS